MQGMSICRTDAYDKRRVVRPSMLSFSQTDNEVAVCGNMTGM